MESKLFSSYIFVWPYLSNKRIHKFVFNRSCCFFFCKNKGFSDIFFSIRNFYCVRKQFKERKIKNIIFEEKIFGWYFFGQSGWSVVISIEMSLACTFGPICCKYKRIQRRSKLKSRFDEISINFTCVLRISDFFSFWGMNP